MKAVMAAIVLGAVGSGAAGCAAGPEVEPKREWRELPMIQDGKVAPGWTQIGGGEFVVDDGSLRTACGDTMGMLLYAQEKFGNCQLKVVFKCQDADANSGVFIRIDDGVLELQEKEPAPLADDTDDARSARSIENLQEASEQERGVWYPVHHGFEVQICEAGDDHHRTGAIYSLTSAAQLPELPPDGWRTLVISLNESRVEVDVDGKRVTTFDSAAPDLPPRSNWYEPKREIKRPHAGYIGLQTHDPGDVVWFKEVSVRPLPTTAQGALRVHPENPRYFNSQQ